MLLRETPRIKSKKVKVPGAYELTRFAVLFQFNVCYQFAMAIPVDMPALFMVVGRVVLLLGPIQLVGSRKAGTQRHISAASSLTAQLSKQAGLGKPPL